MNEAELDHKVLETQLTNINHDLVMNKLQSFDFILQQQKQCIERILKLLGDKDGV